MARQEKVPSDPKMTLFLCATRKPDEEEDEEMDDRHVWEKSLMVKINLHPELVEGGFPVTIASHIED